MDESLSLFCSNQSLLFFQLLDIIFRDSTLSHVTQSVTRNGKSIMLTMMLALILIYLFSLLGFVFFRDDFLSNIQKKKHSIRYRQAMALTRMSICRCLSFNSFLSVFKTNSIFLFFFFLFSNSHSNDHRERLLHNRQLHIKQYSRRSRRRTDGTCL